MTRLCCAQSPPAGAFTAAATHGIMLPLLALVARESHGGLEAQVRNYRARALRWVGAEPSLSRLRWQGLSTGASVFSRLLRGMLFGITPFDPPTFTAAALVVLIAAVPSYIPARRATQVSPVQALRAD